MQLTEPERLAILINEVGIVSGYSRGQSLTIKAGPQANDSAKNDNSFIRLESKFMLCSEFLYPLNSAPVATVEPLDRQPALRRPFTLIGMR